MRPQGWRKFVLAGAALCMGFLLARGALLTADFVNLAAIVVGAFAAGNAVEHWRRSGS
jgi:hypothetical protein